MSSPVAAPLPPLLENLGTPTPTSVLSTLPSTVTSSTTTTTTRSALPDYVQTLTVRDANGQVRELVFPKGLDLDRPKRARTTFTSDQLAALEREFRRNQYLVGRERSLLAARLGLSETQVKVWYQNRRTKHKRDREREHEAPMTILPSTLSSSTALPPISRPLLQSMPPNQPPVNTSLFSFPSAPAATPHPVTTSSIHSLPSKMCQTSPEITSSTPTTTANLTAFSLEGQTVTCARKGQNGREGAEEQETQGGRGLTPPTSIKPPSPSRFTRSISGLDYHFGLSGMGGPMGGVTKADLSSTTHALEMSFSKSLPSLLGSFHSVPPTVSPSAFRPLFPRPLHHPLALQHHALARSHPTWLP